MRSTHIAPDRDATTPLAPRTVFTWNVSELLSCIAVLLSTIAVVVVFLLAIDVKIEQRSGSLPPCQTEDSTGCYWDASEHGNGLGDDLIVPPVGATLTETSDR